MTLAGALRRFFEKQGILGEGFKAPTWFKM